MSDSVMLARHNLASVLPGRPGPMGLPVRPSRTGPCFHGDSTATRRLTKNIRERELEARQHWITVQRPVHGDERHVAGFAVNDRMCSHGVDHPDDFGSRVEPLTDLCEQFPGSIVG